MRKLLILLFAFVACACAQTTTQYLWFGPTGGTNITVGNEWYALQSSNQYTSGNTNQTNFLVPTGGQICSIGAWLHTAPGGSTSWTFSLYKNGSIPSGAPAVTITGSATAGADTSHCVSVALGDYISVEQQISGSPTATLMSGYVGFVPTVEGETIFGSSGGTPSGSSNQYSGLGTGVFTNGAANGYTVIPVPGTFKKAYVQMPSNGTGETVVYNFMWAASGGTPATVLTASLTTGTNSVTALTGTQAVSAGDVVEFNVSAPAGTAVNQNYYISIVFVPTTLGQFIIPAFRNTAQTTAEWYQVANRCYAETPELNAQMVFPAMQIAAFAALRAAAPGASATQEYQLRDNATTETAVECSISGASAVYCTSTGLSFSVSQWDLLDTLLTNTAGSPGATTLAMSYAGYIAPVGGGVSVVPRHH
jgi:hypothetical protein